jgi:hypothetical protein
MRSVFRLQALRSDSGFRSLPYILEAKAHSLLLIPLHRRWLITSTLFSAFFMVPVIIAVLWVIGLVDRASPVARFPAGVAYVLVLTATLILGFGWSQRLALRFAKPSQDKILHPGIKDVRPGKSHSTLTVETEEGTMSLVVQARNRTITQALELAS